MKQETAFIRRTVLFFVTRHNWQGQNLVWKYDFKKLRKIKKGEVYPLHARNISH